MNIPPTIYIAGPNANDRAINPSRSGPVRLPPVPEPSDASPASSREAFKNGTVKLGSTGSGIEQPISLPDSSGRLATAAKAGSLLNLRA